MYKTLPFFTAFFLIANAFLVTANIPLFIRVAKTPPDRTFPLVHGDWPHDYYLYLSAITEGSTGDWLYHTNYTTEPTTAGIFYIFYIWVGKVAAIFHFAPQIAYHLATLFSVELFFMSIFSVSLLFFPPFLATIASVLGLLGTIAPPFVYNFLFHEYISFPIYIPWWIALDALERMYLIPHYLFGQSLLLFSVLNMIMYFRQKKGAYLISSSLLLFIGGIIFPPVVFPFAIGIPCSFFIISLQRIYSFISHQSQRIFNRHLLFGSSTLVLTSILCLMVIRTQEHQGFPWNQWTAWGIWRWNFNEPNFDKELFLSFGIFPLLSFPAMVHMVRSKKMEHLFLIFWAIFPFMLLPFATSLGIIKVRLVHAASFIPFGLLSTYTIFHIIPPIKRNVLRIGTIFLIFIICLSVSISILIQRIRYVKEEPVYFHNYLFNNSLEIIQFIKNNIPKNSVFLTWENMGLVIPAFTPQKSYYAHMTLTKDFGLKTHEVKDFYSQKISTKKAMEFLKKNGISYVYFGPFEKDAGGVTKLSYPFLHVVFQTATDVLYKVE